MIESTPPPIGIARQLFAHISPPSQAPDALLETVEIAYGQLRGRMVLLLGQAGFDALWPRALHMVQPGVQSLPLVVNGHDPVMLRERLLTVFTNCFTLVYTFIGEDLGFRLIQQTWPTVRFSDLEQAEGTNA